MMPLKPDSRPRSIAIRLAVLIFASLFQLPLLSAQLHSLDVSQYLHTSWTAQEGYFRGIGVSNNGIAQTVDGYLWFLSPTGVFRFDGARFVEWKPRNGEPLPGVPPSQMLASRNGSLWLAGRGAGELRADGTWHTYHELDKLTHVRLAEDKDGVIWAGAENSPAPNDWSLFRIDHGKASSYKIPEIVGLGFTPLFVGKQGKLWADSETGIWQILPGHPKLLQRKTLRSPVFSEDPQGALLYAHAGKIWRLSDEGISKDYLGELVGSAINARAMLCDREGGLWIGTTGQGILHLHEGHIDHFSSLDGLSSDIVESIFQDREGNVWVTSPESIDKFTKPAVPRVTRKQELSGDSVYSVLTDRRGETWIGTSNGFNKLIADQMIRPGTQPQSDPALAALETHAGRVLMTTHARDQTMAPDNKRIVPAGSRLAWLEGYKNVFSFVEDGEDTLWAVSQELGLLHLRQNGELIEALNDPQWGDYALSLVFDLKRDGIWFTTHNGKVFFVRGGKIIERYGRADGLGDGPVRVLQVDDDGGVWIAKQAGLVRLMDHKLSVLGIKNGLPCDRVHWMRTDQDHHIWLYTECGLISLSERDLSSWIADPSRSVTITNYLDNTQGVENTAIAGWYTPLSAKTRDGRILFAMRTGLGVLDPRHLNQNALPPPVYVEGITADGREIVSTSRALLPAKTSTIRITFTALSFAAPHKVRFRYKLEGYDRDWSPPVSLREVTYTNLPSRNYSFKVIACNNNGVWNEQGATVGFTVLPAFYQTRWFVLLCTTALISLIWLILRWRVKRVTAAIQERAEVRADERVRIARDLHDTLLQGIQGLMLHFHVAAQNFPEGSRPREAADRALATADRIVAEGRDRVNRLRSDHFTLKELTDAFKAIAADLNYEQRIRFSLKIEGRGADVASPVLSELHYIGREAIGNAFRHAEPSEITVRLMCGPKSVVLVVVDNGHGFDPMVQQISPRTGHWGLRGMKERAEVIGARFECHSTPAKGTEVTVTVPTHRAYRKNSLGKAEPDGSVSQKSKTV